MSDGASPRSAALVGPTAWPADLLPPSTTRADLPPWISTPGTRGRPAAVSRNNTASASRLAFLVAQSHLYRLFVLPFPLSFGPPSWNHSPRFSHVPKTLASALLLAPSPTRRIDHHLLVLSSSNPSSSTSCPLTSSSFATDGICVATGLLIQSLSPPAVFRATLILLSKLSWSECFL
jgi:hypothetical protein